MNLHSPIEAQDAISEDPFLYTSGPRDAPAILVGEAWGSEEAAAKRPFVGSSGKELDRMLSEAGLDRNSILCTNVIHQRPEKNDFTEFLLDAKEKAPPFLGLKVKPELRLAITQLHSLIAAVRPRLIIAAGNLPLWALSTHATIRANYPSGIGTWRGSQTYTREIAGTTYPLLPIIHPAAILREWGFRSVTVQDLRRATRYLQENNGGENGRSEKPNRNGVSTFTRGWSPPQKTFTIHRPIWAQIEQRLSRWLQDLEKGPLELAVDLETYKRKWISVIGLADSKLELCIPLIHNVAGSIQSYLTLEQEHVLWRELKKILEHPNIRIIGQNFIYDTEWFHRYYNISAIVHFDTMVAHHLLFPGTPKRLDYLASLYCDHYLYWKDESGDWDTLPDNADTYWRYNCKDTRATYEIAQVLKQVLKQQGMEELYAFQMEQWKLSRSLAIFGTHFDLASQREMRLQLLEEATLLSEWLLRAVPSMWQYTSTGKPWFDSPKGTASLLYACLSLTPILEKKTKRPTTNDAALQELEERPASAWLYPLLTRLRHLRSLGVFISHFLDARTSPDGRFRGSFNIAHPETFRWSSNSNGFGEGTNLQNIPKGEED